MYARWRRSYTKLSTITAIKKVNKNVTDRNSDNNVMVNHCQSQLTVFFSAETILTFKNCSKENPKNYDKKVILNRRENHCTEEINVVKTIIGRANERNVNVIQVNFLVIVFWVFL